MFNWNGYLDLAIELSEREEESCKRSAISRAYYSAYCNARNFLEDQGYSLDSKENAHAAVWNTFFMIRKNGLNRIAAIGDRLKRKRQQADYDNKIEQLNIITQRAIDEAKQIQSILEQNKK
ncbi:hypothetical protein [Thermaerobacillus caldiproteolyticus]|uniref:hypothetical protein n=1 Tax=Thermaerobacillus caldiproteolyticus TaxID=247480 RepID=UPI00188C9093|nr:hypothetical protein [Anoxybacillus caldiproteolyticus]QPA31615.1 hypothetical protein ISX45_00900 [Anoxybacillus caldiproteolyticus]